MSGNQNSGRKSRSHLTAEARRLLDEAAVDGARYIRDVNAGKQKGKVSTAKLESASLAINHSLGKPKATLTVTDGKVRTMADVASLAATGRLADGTVPTTDDELSYVPEAQDGVAPGAGLV